MIGRDGRCRFKKAQHTHTCASTHWHVHTRTTCCRCCGTLKAMQIFSYQKSVKGIIHTCHVDMTHVCIINSEGILQINQQFAYFSDDLHDIRALECICTWPWHQSVRFCNTLPHTTTYCHTMVLQDSCGTFEFRMAKSVRKSRHKLWKKEDMSQMCWLLVDKIQ